MLVSALLGVALAAPPAPGATVHRPTTSLCPTACAAGTFYSLDDETCLPDEGAEAGAPDLVVSSATGAIETVTTCTEAAIQDAISDVADVVRGTTKVGIVVLPACTVDLTGALWLESGVVLWGEGATTFRADPDLDATSDPACLTATCTHFGTDCDGWQCMIAGRDVHRTGVVGVTLDGRQDAFYCATSAEWGAPADCRRAGIRIWGASSDLLFHDVAAVYLNSGIGLGHNVPSASSVTPDLRPSTSVERVTISCSTALHAGRYEALASEWPDSDCPPYFAAIGFGGGFTIYDSVAHWRMESLSTRCVGGNAFNLKGADGAVLGALSTFDARSKTPGAERVTVRASAFDRPKGYASSTHATALSVQAAYYLLEGETRIRYPADFTITGNRFRRRESVDVAVEVLGGLDGFHLGANLYEGPTDAQGLRAKVILYNTDGDGYSTGRLECLRYTPPSSTAYGYCEVDEAWFRLIPLPDPDPFWTIVKPGSTP